MLGITQTMKTTIEDQLSGDTPATNNGKGSGDGAGMMGRPGMRNRPQEGNVNLPPMSPEGFQGQPPEGFQEGEVPPPPMGEFQGEPPEGMQGNFEGGRTSNSSRRIPRRTTRRTYAGKQTWYETGGNGPNTKNGTHSLYSYRYTCISFYSCITMGFLSEETKTPIIFEYIN